MNKAEKYDIKEASNPELTKKARKNYADNAQHNVKKYDGPKAVAAGKKRLDEDISSMINMSSTSMGSGVNMKSGCQVSKHMSR